MKHGWLKLAGSALLLASCAVGPDYSPPPVDVPKAYKEAYGNWQPAQPNDAIHRGAWWTVYNDPMLDNLIKQVEISNQNLRAAEASWRQARAIVEQSRSTLFPVVTADASKTRAGGGRTPATTTYNLAAGASWVPDVWGRIRRTVEGDVASAQSSAADIALARLAAQAELAANYFTLRGLHELRTILNQTAESNRRALKIVENQYEAGIVAKGDVLTARTQVESVKSQAIGVGVQRAQLEHAIAVLVGKPPAAIAIAPAPLAKTVPKIPVSLPSTLLERRPDIAAAERQMAAANADIGVAISAWFPDLTLSGSYGYAGASLGSLIAAPNSIWSFGPALAATLFDAGLRQGQVDEARAVYDQTVAIYRQTVLTAFQQVEDQLAALRILEEQAKVQRQLVADARKAEELVLNQYKAGTVPFSSVTAAQITRLNNEQSALTVRQNRILASVALIEALGGGWDVSELAKDQPDKPKAQEPEVSPVPPAKTEHMNAAPGTVSNINQGR